MFGHNNSRLGGYTISSGCQEEIDALTEKWHMVAVKDGDDYQLYFNGNLDATASGNANCTNLHIAQDKGTFRRNGLHRAGLMRLFYDRALSQQEVAELFALEGVVSEKRSMLVYFWVLILFHTTGHFGVIVYPCIRVSVYRAFVHSPENVQHMCYIHEIINKAKP